MNQQAEAKHELALEFVIKMTVDIVAARHGWTVNETIEKLSQLSVFDNLSNQETGLWTESPVDLAAMIEIELDGGVIPPDYYFK